MFICKLVPLYIWFFIKGRARGNWHPVTVIRSVSGKNSQTLETLSKNLNLIVSNSVKYCRHKGDKKLTSKARCDMIGNFLILVLASIGRENPSQSEFKVCVQKLIALVPEMKDPLAPIHRKSFIALSPCTSPTILKGYKGGLCASFFLFAHTMRPWLNQV